MLHKFGEGSVVEAHRHPHGGGWVADTARVAETVYVGSTAEVSGRARVWGNVVLTQHAAVFGEARVWGDVWLTDCAVVYGHAQVSGDVELHGVAAVYDHAQVWVGKWDGVFAGEARVGWLYLLWRTLHGFFWSAVRRLV
jgi:acyl-[acyl carrier protein]--UDP-N-acetylglucosamine O-acyltransferase